MKIGPVEAELFFADRRVDLMQVIVAFSQSLRMRLKTTFYVYNHAFHLPNFEHHMLCHVKR